MLTGPYNAGSGRIPLRRESAMKRAAIYVRVSTDRQTVENQTARLTQIAEARGWQIVQTFSDAGVSGAKGRNERSRL